MTTKQMIVTSVALAALVMGCSTARVSAKKQTAEAEPADGKIVVTNNCPQGDGRPYFIQVRHDDDSASSAKLDFSVLYRLADGRGRRWTQKTEGKGTSRNIDNVLTIDGVNLRGAKLKEMRAIEVRDRVACEIVVTST